MWQNSVDRDRPQMTVWRMRIACWICKAKAINTTQNMQDLRLFHCKNGCTNVPHCCIVGKLPALLSSKANENQRSVS